MNPVQPNNPVDPNDIDLDDLDLSNIEAQRIPDNPGIIRRVGRQAARDSVDTAARVAENAIGGALRETAESIPRPFRDTAQLGISLSVKVVTKTVAEVAKVLIDSQDDSKE